MFYYVRLCIHLLVSFKLFGYSCLSVSLSLSLFISFSSILSPSLLTTPTFFPFPYPPSHPFLHFSYPLSQSLFHLFSLPPSLLSSYSHKVISEDIAKKPLVSPTAFVLWQIAIDFITVHCAPLKELGNPLAKRILLCVSDVMMS